MVIFARLTASAVSVLLCVFLLRSHFPVDPILPRKTVALFFGSWILLGTGTVLLDFFFVPALLSAIMAGILSLTLGRIPVKKMLPFGLTYGFLQLAASGAALLLTHYFPANGQCRILLEILVLYALSVYICVFSERWNSVSGQLLQLLPVWLIAVVLSEEAIRNRGESNVIILEIMAFIWLIYAGILPVHVGNRMDDQVRALEKKQQKARHYALREEYYQQLRDKQTETRALWHDLNKYLRAAKTEMPSVQALDQLEEMLNSATQIVDVGNQVLNVILNEYALAAKAAGIELRLKVRVPPKLAVSVADLYILIGNTMDNAIEACSALPADQRVVDLLLRTHNDILYYKLMNPYDPTQARQLPEPMRGHGLPNVRRCVERYGGTVNTEDENGFFTVTAHLNIDTSATE